MRPSSSQAEFVLSDPPVLSQPPRCLHDYFEDQARRNPAAIALTCGRRQVTYGELDESAGRWAASLRERGVGPEVLVGICAERSPGLVMGLLAILKAGGAYVPLDPGDAPERLTAILDDARPKLLLTEERLAARLAPAGTPMMLLDRPPAETAGSSAVKTDASPDNLAYIIYTSGSTGKPKGVQITHRSVASLFAATQPRYRFDDGDVWTLFHSVAFDFSVWEIFGALLHGGRLVIVPFAVSRSPQAFHELLRTERVTVLNQTPSAFRLLLQADASGEPLALRYVIFGGEALDLRMLRPWFERHGDQCPQLVNMYGITETTVFVTWRPLSSGDLDRPSVIGEAIPDWEVHLLDERLRPVPPGTPGEICVGGPGLARGYLNNPELTARKFVPHPFSGNGDRIYRSGDLARQTPDGDIEYLGRMDQQVKIRGHRVELGEIESALREHPAVDDCAVVVREDVPGEKRLIAYFTIRRGQNPTGLEFRNFLRPKLPAYMTPALFVRVEEMPLTNNGKLDRRALPAPRLRRAAPDDRYVAPRDPLERELTAVWETLLRVEPVGIRDQFFELGGHSLLAAQLFAQVEDLSGKRIPSASWLERPTVEHLAELIREHAASRGDSLVLAIQEKGSKPPLFLIHGAGGGMLWGYTNLAMHLSPEQVVYGIQSRGLHGGEELETIEAMATWYLDELHAVQPRGPYFLGGYCFGGNIAYEMARQLREQGERVALLALFETNPCDGSYDRVRWWTPRFAFEFLRNSFYWLQYFAQLEPGTRRAIFGRRLRHAWRRLAGTQRAGGNDGDLENVVDVSQIPEDERRLWRIHIRAMEEHVSRPYDGHVTLFRTRRQRFWCSFDAAYGWRDLVAGGVTVRIIPGVHDRIFVEPDVRSVAEELQKSLDAAQLVGMGAAKGRE